MQSWESAAVPRRRAAPCWPRIAGRGTLFPAYHASREEARPPCCFGIAGRGLARQAPGRLTAPASLGTGESQVSADLGHETSRRAKAGPAIRRAVCGGSYTPPKRSGCFGPTVTTTGESTTPRASQLASCRSLMKSGPTPAFVLGPVFALTAPTWLPVSESRSPAAAPEPPREVLLLLRETRSEVPGRPDARFRIKDSGTDLPAERAARASTYAALRRTAAWGSVSASPLVASRYASGSRSAGPALVLARAGSGVLLAPGRGPLPFERISSE